MYNYIGCILLELSFYSVSCSKFFVLTYNIPEMFISKNCASNMIFLAHIPTVMCCRHASAKGRNVEKGGLICKSGNSKPHSGVVNSSF
jgi:hypothetical protein